MFEKNPTQLKSISSVCDCVWCLKPLMWNYIRRSTVDYPDWYLQKEKLIKHSFFVSTYSFTKLKRFFENKNIEGKPSNASHLKLIKWLLFLRSFSQILSHKKKAPCKAWWCSGWLDTLHSAFQEQFAEHKVYILAADVKSRLLCEYMSWQVKIKRRQLFILLQKHNSGQLC